MSEGVTACCRERNGARKETHEVVHLGEEGAVEPIWKFAEYRQVRMLCVGKEVFADTVERVGPHCVVDGLLKGCLEVLFDQIFCGNKLDNS